MSEGYCPKCGKPGYYGDEWCGACEGAYQQEVYETKQREIVEVNAEIKACGCEEPCSACNTRIARRYSLLGDETAAEYFLNR